MKLPRRISPLILNFLVLLLLLLTVNGQQKPECPVRVTLLQLNDVYQFAPVDGGANGGLARVVTIVKEIRQQSPHTIFLLAGDTISPSVESITYKGAQMIDSWNTAGLDYATFGNHEFDFGPEVLSQRMTESKFGWLAANVIDRRTKKPFGNAQPSVIREFNGVKVGIFGLVLPETKNTSRPGPEIDFLDPCETAKKMVAELHAKGARVVVALTHLSMREDKEVARCADVDVVIGGHEHTLLESAAGGAPIFKMTSDARQLGQIDLNISPTDGKLESIDWRVIPVTAAIKEDPGFLSFTTKYGALLKELSRVVGRTAVELDARSAVNRNRETNAGNFIADAFRRAVRADVGLINGGSIRADATIGPGILTMRDLLSMLPFKNKIVKVELTGAQLRAVLEHGVSRSGEDAEPGRFPQVSGVEFTFDARRPVGSRIVSVLVNKQPLDEQNRYTLATTNFLTTGGDDYAMLQTAPQLIKAETGPLDSDVLRATLAAVRAIAPRIDGRIKRLDTNSGPQDCR